MASLGIVVSPMEDAALFIPLIFPPKLYVVPFSKSINAWGNVNIVAPTAISILGTLDADGIALTSDAMNLVGGPDSISGRTLALATDDPSLDIHLGPNLDTSGALDIEAEEVLALKDGFTDIRIGRADGTGTITLYNSV